MKCRYGQMQIGANAGRAKALSLKILSLKRFSLPAPVSDIGIRSSGENCPEGSNTGFVRQCYFLRYFFCARFFYARSFCARFFYATFFCTAFLPMFLRLIFCYAMVWCFWCYVSHFYFFGSFVACDQSLTSRHCYRGFEKIARIRRQ